MLNEDVSMAYEAAKLKLSGAGYSVRVLDEDLIEENNGRYALAVDTGGKSFSSRGIQQIADVLAWSVGYRAEVASAEGCYLVGFRQRTLGERVGDVLTGIGGYFYWLAGGGF